MGKLNSDQTNLAVDKGIGDRLRDAAKAKGVTVKEITDWYLDYSLKNIDLEIEPRVVKFKPRLSEASETE